MLQLLDEQISAQHGQVLLRVLYTHKLKRSVAVLDTLTGTKISGNFLSFRSKEFIKLGECGLRRVTLGESDLRRVTIGISGVLLILQGQGMNTYLQCILFSSRWMIARVEMYHRASPVDFAAFGKSSSTAEKRQWRSSRGCMAIHHLSCSYCLWNTVSTRKSNECGET